MDNLFSQGMNTANTAFGLVAGEKFKLISGGAPGAGEVTSVSIDDLATSQKVVMGGLKQDVQMQIWINRDERHRAGIKPNGATVIEVRGRKMRVQEITDDGDNTELLTCTSAAIQM